MTHGARPVCFTCGLPVENRLQFNRLPNGQVCPACRDRLLEAIPPAIPRRDLGPVPELGTGSGSMEEAQEEGDWDGDSRPWPPPGLAS